MDTETVVQETEVQKEYGKPHPKAPKELLLFSFLIGEWNCVFNVKHSDGIYEKRPLVWVGRYILDGYMIAEEWHELDSAGHPVKRWQNYRFYNSVRQAWVIKLVDGFASTWLDTKPEDLSSLLVDDDTITYLQSLPCPGGKAVPPNALFRYTFFDISSDRFSLRVQLSPDNGNTWDVVQVIQAHRALD